MRTFKPLIMLLVIPLVILLLAYGAVKLLNTGITGNSFYVEMQKDIIFPWEDTVAAVAHLDLSQLKMGEDTMVKANILIILDNSDSMGKGTDSPIELAKEAIANFIDNFGTGKQNQIGIIAFSHEVNETIPLTKDIGALKKSLAALTAKAGGTDFTPPLEMAACWLDKYKGQNNFIIFLTDGGVEEADCQKANQVYQNQVAAEGIDMFAIGIGRGAWIDILRLLVTDKSGNVPPNRVLTCEDPSKLPVIFDRAAEEIGNTIGKNGTMIFPLAANAFHWRETPVPTDRSNPLVLPFPVVFARPYTCHMVTEPDAWGIIRPFYDKIPFNYIDTRGSTQQLTSAKIPYLLHITYWFLALLYLPSLLYWLFTRSGHAVEEAQAREVVIVPFDTRQLPGQLPRRFIHDKAEIEWIPTLVIGLGRTGRHILTHLKQDVEELPRKEDNPLRFLNIDVAASEVDGPHPDHVPGVIAALDRETEIYIPAANLRNVKDKVYEYRDKTDIDVEDPYSSLNLAHYAALPDEILGLNNGTARNPALARAYFIKEMEQGSQSPLLNLLEKHLRELNRLAQHSQFMQILIAANSSGGVGSGLIADLSVLLRRLSDKTKDEQTSVEINLLLVEDRYDHDDPGRVPIQNNILLDELNLLSQAGRVNIPYHLVPKLVTVNGNQPTPNDDEIEQKFLQGPGTVFTKRVPGRRRQEELLNGILSARPYNNIYVYAQRTDRPEFHLFPQVADSALLFIERAARNESRHLLESIKKQEGMGRRNKKIEFHTHITTRSILYPSHLIKETLKLLFLNDIFSSKIALPGLSYENNVPVIKKQGNIDDLFRHPLVTPLSRQELGHQPQKWTALIMGQHTANIDINDKSLLDDTENFWGYLEKAIPLLLSEGVFSLTGLIDVSEEMQTRLKDAQAGWQDTTEREEIDKTVMFLENLAINTREWLQCILGTKENKGLLEILQTRMKKIETVKAELLSMDKCRVVLGVHVNTPGSYNIETLRKTWLARWLGVKDQQQVYLDLKKRFNWKIMEKGVLKPGISFEFIGTDTYVFSLQPDFKEELIQRADEIAEQFLVNLKEVTILELLLEYEKTASSLYSRKKLAQKLHEGSQAPDLYYIYLLPHASRIRLSSAEQNYLERLEKEDFKEIKRVEEVFIYPPSSNQYRLYSLQVSSLLPGTPRQETTDFNPLHMTEILKQANKKMIRERFNIVVPDLLPLHYLVFYYPGKFKTFVNLWVGGSIFKDDFDGLWKVQTHDRIFPLTFSKDEPLEEAAVFFVMNMETIYGKNLPTSLPPDNERLKKLDVEANKRNTFYCWMKLYK